jgi:putative ABC transport system ATP-binding protein
MMPRSREPDADFSEVALVHIDRVTKIFNPGEVNEVTAVREVTLRVPERQFLVVIGGNGSGKSTLLNLVAGSVFPTQGRIAISEKDVTDVPEYERAGLIGHVFQDPLKGTAANLTIEENFSLAASPGDNLAHGRIQEAAGAPA